MLLGYVKGILSTDGYTLSILRVRDFSNANFYGAPWKKKLTNGFGTS